MKSKSGIQVFAVIALFINILASLFLFGRFKNIQPGFDELSLLAYSSIIAIVVCSFILFLMFMLARSSTSETEIHADSNTVISEKEEETSNYSSNERILDIDDLRSKAIKCIPKGALSPTGNYSLKKFADEVLSQIANISPIVEGLFYLRGTSSDEFVPIGDYAYFSENKPTGFKLGETLPGQVAKNKKAMNISDIPDSYVKIASGLGMGSPRHLYFLPILDNVETIAVIEIASFMEFDKEAEKLLEFVAFELSKVLVQLRSRNL
jgi:hypothetical protein